MCEMRTDYIHLDFLSYNLPLLLVCFSCVGEKWILKIHSCEHYVYSHQNIHILEANTGAGEMAQGKLPLACKNLCLNV